ncbi:MAG: WhiB family transcriptional regulator [Pseudonocardia sp.]
MSIATPIATGSAEITDDEANARLPCHSADADLWFAERPDQIDRAQRLCRECPIRRQCLAAALSRREPWGVWGGEIFERGRVIPFKRGRGRPARSAPPGGERPGGRP